MQRQNKIVLTALKEDISKGDITTNCLISKNKIVTAKIISNEKAIVCGIELVKQVFKSRNSQIKFKSFYKDGQNVLPNKAIIKVQGNARAILTCERVALNFLSHLSGIATQTNKFVEEIRPYKAKILDTRKTIPGMRDLQKYAVICGGGFNHRLGLNDMILIKDNHKNVLGKNYKIDDLIKLARKKNWPKKIEVEVESLAEFRQALKANPDIIMLDNMDLVRVKAAVRILKQSKSRSTTKLEVSGNVSLKNIRQFAKSGVDFISIGELTHSVKAIDMSLEVI